MNQGNSFEKFLDISTLGLHGNFDAQVTQLMSAVRLSRAEVENLNELVADLTATLSESWPNCKVHPFGSIIMGLGIRSSDIDCYVSLPHWANNNQKAIVYRAKQLLMKERFKFAEVFCIPQAKVPIVKFYHLPTDRNCDVNFKSLAGVQNSKLLAYLLHLDPRALPLAILVKYWSKVHVLTGTNLVPNYAMTLMVVFYLQHVNILPPVHLLQQNTNELIVENWNTAFSEIQYQNSDKMTVYQLLGGFFDYYASYDYEKHVVCPFLGCSMQKSCLTRASQLPKEFKFYKTMLESNPARSIRIDTAMCIQDPFDHSRNCTVAVNIRLWRRLITRFKNAANAFYNGRSEDYLKTVMVKSTDDEEPSKPHRKDNTPPRVAKRREHNGLPRNLKKNIHVLYDQYVKQKRRRH